MRNSRESCARSALMVAAMIAAMLGAGREALAQTAPAGPAQMAPVRKVEFEEAIKQALAKNPSIQQATVNIARAEALVKQARAGLMPFVSASLSNITLNSERGFEGAVTQPQNQTTFGATAGLPILPIAQRARVDQARDQVDVASKSVEEVRQQIAVAAAETYIAVVTARRQVEVDMRAIENARAHLDYAQKRLEGGAGSRLNQMRAAQALSSDESHLEVTRLALIRAQEALGVLLAEPGPVDAGADPVFEQPGPLDEPAWMSTRRDVQTEQSIRRAAERAVKDSWKDWLPLANASFDPTYVAPSSVFTPSGAWRLSFFVTQPIFDGGERKAAEQLRRADLEQSAFALSIIEIQARSEVRVARAAIDQLQRAATTSRLAADQANEVLQITTSAFQLGATTNIEVIDAQRIARDTEAAAALAEDAVRRAQLDLLVALGRFPR